MHKRTITFEDYNGQEVTEDFYFNLSKAELVELQLSTKEGFTEKLNAIIKSEDGQQIIDHFKMIILMAVGQKSPDGRRFIKNQELRDDFSQTEAYPQLFVELATDAGAAAVFINGIVPAGLAQEVEVEVAQVIDVELPTAPPVLETPTEKPEPTDEEILKMKGSDMTREQLQRAYALRSQMPQQ